MLSISMKLVLLQLLIIQNASGRSVNSNDSNERLLLLHENMDKLVNVITADQPYKSTTTLNNPLRINKPSPQARPSKESKQECDDVCASILVILITVGFITLTCACVWIVIFCVRVITTVSGASKNIIE